MRESREHRNCIIAAIITAVLLTLGLSALSAHSAPVTAAPPILPAVKIRRVLPAMKLLLRDNKTVVTIKETEKGVQIDIIDLQLPK
jgi:hypothetical protein